MREVREGWPEIWSRCRRDRLFYSLRLLTIAACATVVLFSIAVINKVYFWVGHFLPRFYPWSSYHVGRRERAREQSLLEKHFLGAGDKSACISEIQSPQGLATNETRKDVFFSRLPAEIRRQILIHAFGDQTIHMELRFGYPYNLEDKCGRSHRHARLQLQNGGNDTDVLSGPRNEKEWRWFSCLCHRFPPAGNEHLPFGRRRNWPSSTFGDPGSDFCMKGMSIECKKYPGEWPVKCQIGISGFLRTSKQAYFEGRSVLYGTNTIQIASPVLHRSIHEILPRQRLADLVSLELVWQPHLLPFKDGFARARQRDGPIFPSLIYLRIDFIYLTYGEMDHAVGLVWPYEDKNLLSKRLHQRLYPEIDDMLSRIVPPTTDVLVTCPKWAYYELTDLYLVEKQGTERTKLQRADIEGLKCWRETPKKNGRPVDDRTVEGGTCTEPVREGFWVHIPPGDAQIDHGCGYDWHRHELYNLGDKRYRYC